MRIDSLQGRNGDVPENLTPDVLPWLFISWEFQKEKPFQQAAKILQVEGDADIEERSLQELCLPDRIMGTKIPQLLQVSLVNDFLAELQSGRCTVECWNRFLTP
jgi:hypothetical protein